MTRAIVALALWALRRSVTVGLWGLAAGLVAAGLVISELPQPRGAAMWRRVHVHTRFLLRSAAKFVDCALSPARPAAAIGSLHGNDDCSWRLRFRAMRSACSGPTVRADGRDTACFP